MLQSALDRDHKARAFEQTIRQPGEIVRNDPAMYERFDKTPDKESVINVYAALGAEKDLQSTKEDLLVVVQEQMQGPDWVVPKIVLSPIAERCFSLIDHH